MTFKSKMHPYGIEGPRPMGTGSRKIDAKTIAQKLDAADGKVDGKIDKSVWNDFIRKCGGNSIKNYISVDNAADAINRYNASPQYGAPNDKGSYMRNANSVAQNLYKNLSTGSQFFNQRDYNQELGSLKNHEAIDNLPAEFHGPNVLQKYFQQ